MNSAIVVVLFALSASSSIKRSSIAVLLESMYLSSSEISFRTLDTSTRVVEAASLSVFIMDLLSPIP